MRKLLLVSFFSVFIVIIYAQETNSSVFIPQGQTPVLPHL